MTQPYKFYIVVNLMYIMTMISYISLATIGYLAYGMNAKENIIDNFIKTSFLTKAIIFLLIITIITKFILTAYPLTEGLIDLINHIKLYLSHHYYSSYRNRSKNLILRQFNHNIIYQDIIESPTQMQSQYDTSLFWIHLLIRTCLPIIAMILSIILPDFIHLMSFIGCTFGSFICLIIPILSYLQIYRYNLFIYEKIGLWFILLFGSICAIVSIILT